ncbi:MAG: hypothetical protein LQ337_006500 [Flavoplaca oasis]|nr:MAG: hypothetical protein LQ337_006500 [Flavoplaca oasis]
MQPLNNHPPSLDPLISAKPLSEAEVLWSFQLADAKDLDELVPPIAGRPAPGLDAAAFAVKIKNQQVEAASKGFTSTMAALDIANFDPGASFDSYTQSPAMWKYVDGRASPNVDDVDQQPTRTHAPAESASNEAVYEQLAVRAPWTSPQFDPVPNSRISSYWQLTAASEDIRLYFRL